MSEPFNDSTEATGWSDRLAGLDRQSKIVLIALGGVILLLAGLILGAVFGGDSTDRVIGAAAASSLGTEPTAPAPSSTVSTVAETTTSSTTSSSTTTTTLATTTTAATTTTTAPPTTTTAATTTTTTLPLVGFAFGEFIEAGHAIDLDTGMIYTFPNDADLVDPVLGAAVDFRLDEVLLAGSGYNVVVSPMNGAVVTNQDVPDASCNAGTGVFGTTKVFVNFDDIGGSSGFDGYYCFITTEGNFGLAIPIEVTGTQDPVGFFVTTVEPPGIP